MAGKTLGVALLLLLLASTTQGRHDVKAVCKQTVRVEPGNDALLPCNIKNSADLIVVSIEWRKRIENNEETKLALYNPDFGFHSFKPNMTIKPEKSDARQDFPIYLPAVTQRDSGTYICTITSFPIGPKKCETELQVTYDDHRICDASSTIEAQSGENVTIHCLDIPDAQYMWMKNNVLVSKEKSLDLPHVTGDHAGVYTVTVVMGRKRVHREFNISVLTVTTSATTGVVTESPQPTVTTHGLIESTDDSLTSPPTTVLLTAATNIILENSNQNGTTCEDNERSHLWVLIMVPALVLITVVGFLIRRRRRKQRMDQPSLCQNPPPPVSEIFMMRV